MNKEKIDGIALRIFDEICQPIDGIDAVDIENITYFAERLLGALAKEQKPIRTALLNKDGGVTLLMTRCDPATHSEFKGYLYSIPLPQPDLVAEIAKLKKEVSGELNEGFNMASDYFKKDASASLVKELRQQLSEAQASEEALLKALEYYANTTYGMFPSVARNAIAAHKARKEQS